MSIDSSLKSGFGLARHRNVLSRAERVAKLSSLNKFDPAGGDPLGLPKVGNRKMAAGSKASKKEKTAEATTAGAAAPAATAGKAAEKGGNKAAGGKK